MFKIDLLPVGKPIDPMARRVGVAHETRGVWTAREEPRGSPFLVMSTFRLRICAAHGPPVWSRGEIWTITVAFALVVYRC